MIRDNLSVGLYAGWNVFNDEVAPAVGWGQVGSFPHVDQNNGQRGT